MSKESLDIGAGEQQAALDSSVRTGSGAGNAEHPPMSAETVAFFQRRDVLAFIEKIRAVAPSVTFAMHEDGADEGVRYFIGNKHGWNSYPRNPGSSIHVIAEDLLGGEAEKHRALAFAEGRALLPQLPATSSPSTPSEEPQPSPPVEEVRPVRVCDCGQEIREPVSGWKYGFPFKYCGDCRAARDKDLDLHDLDTRIAAARVETKPAEPDAWDWDCWSTAGGES